jgi:site-specific DNA recombinase
MGRQEVWSGDTEQARAEHRGILLVYCRQSVSDIDEHGDIRGPSLNQQLDAVLRRPEFQGLTYEHFQDADRSGKETSKRPSYLAMMQRIRNAPGGTIMAVACYDQDRLHRNDMNFFEFMAEMEERGIAVYEANGLISNKSKLSWKIKAVVAQDVREQGAQRVKDNLSYLRSQGQLLGQLPAGYKRDGGKVVEDPEPASIVKKIFAEYATGKFSFLTLANHLNQQGLTPPRGPAKARHNRPPAVRFTGDVLKDILNNSSYLGQVRLPDGDLIEGKHPALVDERTWKACIQIRVRNRRRSSNSHTRYSYPLSPILRCGRCGRTMNGEATPVKPAMKIRLYYGCRGRRRGSALEPQVQRCEAPWIRADVIEPEIRNQLQACLPGGELTEAYRSRLRQSVAMARDPEKVTRVALKRLDEQRERVAWMFERGDLDQSEYVDRMARINADKQRLREAAAAAPVTNELAWCRKQVLDLVTVWDHAELQERSRMLSAIFDRIEVDTVNGEPSIRAFYRPSWKPLFERRQTELNRAAASNSEKGTDRERETGLEPATTYLEGRRSTS